MQEVKEFMRDLFLTRMAEEKRILVNRMPYRQKFFTSDCRWDSRAGTLEMIESELIVSLEKSDSEVAVITEYEVPFYASGVRKHRRRYHLKAGDDSWLIRHVEHQCTVCNGQGDEGCTGCKGKHWR